MMNAKISEHVQKQICNYVIGDIENSVFGYRSGTQLVELFIRLFNVPDLHAGPSRWTLCCATMNYLEEKGELDTFFNTLLSLKNIKKEIKNVDNETANTKRNQAITDINNILISDDLELLDVSGKVKIHAIDDDEFLIGAGGFAKVYLVPGTNKVCKKLKEDFKTNDGIVSRFKNEFRIINSNWLFPRW